MDQRVGAGMQRQIARLVALAGDVEMRHAPRRVPGILDLELAQFVAAQRVKQQGRQDGAIALALEAFGIGGDEQLARLVVADRRRLAFAALGPRPLDALDRIMGHGVSFAEILEQRGQRRETVADGGAAELAASHVVAPGDDVGAGDRAEFVRPGDTGEPHEIADRVLVGAPCAAVAEIGEPLDLGGHVGEPVKFRGGQEAFARDNSRR